MEIQGELHCGDIEEGPHRASVGAECFRRHPHYDANSVDHEIPEQCSGSSEADSDCGGVAEVKVDLEKAEKDCRICQLGLESNAAESGAPIALGCSCKDELGAAHKHCAETWFKIKGNRTCEICGSTAENVTDTHPTEQPEHCNETSNVIAHRRAHHRTEAQGFWQGHRFVNFLLACMIFAFVVSWLFHLNLPG